MKKIRLDELRKSVYGDFFEIPVFSREIPEKLFF
jgi:hypothetical protein